MFPEPGELRDARLRRVTGDDRGIDRTDRYSRHPVGMKIGFRQRVVYAGLVGAERAAALQRQRNALERWAFSAAGHVFSSKAG
jgi:hypothetical protein